MNDLNVDTMLNTIQEALKGGSVFLTSKDKKPNTMVIAWGGTTSFWGKTVFIAPVRKSRYSHDPIDKTGEFTVSIPLDDDLKQALGFCGTKSGRDYDKFSECHLTPAKAQRVSVPIIEECSLHLECRVLFKQEMDLCFADAGLREKWYADGDAHTLFFGEVLACYQTK